MPKTWRAIESEFQRRWWQVDFSWWNPTKPWWSPGPSAESGFAAKLAHRLTYEYEARAALWNLRVRLWKEWLGMFRQFLAILPVGKYFQKAAEDEFNVLMSARWTAAQLHLATAGIPVPSTTLRADTGSKQLPTSLSDIPLTLPPDAMKGQSLN